MAETKLTKKEIERPARVASTEEQVGAARPSSSTIEEDAFAATQSELSGDVGLDDESADAGTATFEREKDLSIENNVRDLLDEDRACAEAHRRGDLRHLRPICGKPIEKARIKALPYVDLCIKDAQAQSRR